MRSAGPTSEISSISLSGTTASASFFCRSGRDPGSLPLPPRSPAARRNRCRSSSTARPCRRYTAPDPAAAHRGMPASPLPMLIFTYGARSKPSRSRGLPAFLAPVQDRLHHPLGLLRREPDRQRAVRHFARRAQPGRRDRCGVERQSGRHARCCAAACPGRWRPGQHRGSGSARHERSAASRAPAPCG